MWDIIGEVPLVALLRLTHLRVPGAGGVLRRRRRGDDRAVHDAAPTHHPALLTEDLVLSGEHSLPEVVFFEQVPEMQQRDCIQNLVTGEVQPHESAHRIRDVDRVLDISETQLLVTFRAPSSRGQPPPPEPQHPPTEKISASLAGVSGLSLVWVVFVLVSWGLGGGVVYYPSQRLGA